MHSPQDPKATQKAQPTVRPIPEMVGATTAPFSLRGGVTHTTFQLHAPTGPAILRADGMPRRVFLRVENMTSKLPAPSFDIYLNLPLGAAPEKHPELRAGTMSTFGLLESSRSDGQHAGNGLTYAEEVTAVFLRLALTREWDGKTVRVSFVPILWDYPLDVTVGRVSLTME